MVWTDELRWAEMPFSMLIEVMAITLIVSTSLM